MIRTPRLRVNVVYCDDCVEGMKKHLPSGSIDLGHGPKASSSTLPHRIEDHEFVFWTGDLNYRVDLSDEEVKGLIVKQDWNALLEHDQVPHSLLPHISHWLGSVAVSY